MEHQDHFKLYGKWFWIGVVVAFLNSIAGLVYSIALIVEKPHRKEGLILLGWTLLVMVVMTILFSAWYPKA
ncbi:MAG: hypothetical protein AAB345_03570 [Patescibacteria group bacterium]